MPPTQGIYSKLIKLLLLTMSFMLWVAPAAGAEELVCRGLRPINDIDDLIYQFYINLDSDCLFEMPVAELEHIWGVEIYTFSRDNIQDEDLFYNKPCKSKKDIFYIRQYWNKDKSGNVFQIKITKKYYDKHGTLFPDGNFPRMLPEPIKVGRSLSALTSLRPQGKRPKNPGKYNLDSYGYYWPSSKKPYKIRLMGTYGVTMVRVGEDY